MDTCRAEKGRCPASIEFKNILFSLKILSVFSLLVISGLKLNKAGNWQIVGHFMKKSFGILVDKELSS